MGKIPRHVPAALALILGLVSSSCLSKGTRKVTRNGVAASQSQPLLSATPETLNEKIAASYNAITSFQATVELSASVGSVYKDKITDYQDVHAYMLFRKPTDIRLLGKLPVVGTTAFDMVSNGAIFKVSLPTRNRFITGENSAPAVSKNSLENLRPQALLGPLLIHPLDPATEVMTLEDDTDEKSSDYVLHFLRKDAAGNTLQVQRAVWFDRTDLKIVRQREFDPDSLISSDTSYKNWTNYNGINFPANVDVKRPKDGYGVAITIEKMEMNAPLTDDKFVLNQPPDAQVQVLGTAPSK